MQNLKFYASLFMIIFLSFNLNAQISVLEGGGFEVNIEPKSVTMKIVKDPQYNNVYLQFQLNNFVDLASINWLKLKFEVGSYPNNSNTLWEFNFGVDYQNPPMHVHYFGDLMAEVTFYNLSDYAVALGGGNYIIGKPHGGNPMSFQSTYEPNLRLPDVVVLLGGNYCGEAETTDDNSAQRLSYFCSACNTLYSSNLISAEYGYGATGQTCPVNNTRNIINDCSRIVDRIAHDSVNELKLYPNPASHEVVFDGVSNVGEIYVMSLSGRMVKTVQLNNTFSYNLDVSNLNPGIYFAKFKQEDGEIITKKFSVLR